MADVLALISQSGYADLVAEHGPLDVGVTAPIATYHSKNKRLHALDGGGTMFLVTVRDGRLLLLAALDNPTFTGERWTGTPNTAAVRDISELVPELQFDNGKGLKTPPEKWAMSLQTPRVLTHDDVVRLRARSAPSASSAYLAAVVAVDPDAARKGRPKPGTPRGTRRERPTQSASVAQATAAEALSSPAAWAQLTDDARQAVLSELAAALTQDGAARGQSFTPSPHYHGVARLGALTHSPSGLAFVVVPGGRYLMGYAADDALAVFGAFGDDEVLGMAEPIGLNYFFEGLDHARPPRVVTVAPFLASQNLVDDRSLLTAAGLDDDGDVFDAVAALGFRLPAEAEWEWLAREGDAVQFVGLPVDEHPLTPVIVPPVNEQHNGWGFGGLHNTYEPMADAWHPDYADAPATSEPWAGDDARRPVRGGHTWWQSHEEVTGLTCAARLNGDDKGLRLALDLPFDVPIDDAPTRWEDAVAGVVDVLFDRLKKARYRALLALGAVTSKPGPDTVALVAAILPRLGDVRAADLPGVLWRIGLAAHVELDAAEVGPLRRLLDEHADALIALLRDKQVDVRSCANYVVAACAERASDALAAVRRELGKERREDALAGLTLALSHLAKASGDGAPELAELRASKKPQVAAAAALGAAHLDGLDADGALFDDLSRAAGVPMRAPTRLPWRAGALGKAAFDLVTSGPAEVREEAARKLSARLRDGGSRADADAALQLVFDEVPQGELRAPEALTQVQRDVLCNLSWHRWQNVAFARFGVPESVEDRWYWLGLEEPGAMEREVVTVDGGAEPFHRWHRRVIRSFMDRPRDDPERAAALTEVISGLDALHQLGLHLEVGRFHIWDGRMPGLRPLDELVDELAASDSAGLRAVAERRLAVHERLYGMRIYLTTRFAALAALAASLGPDEVLDPRWDLLLMMNSDVSERVWPRVPADRRTAILRQDLAQRVTQEDRMERWSIFSSLLAKKVGPALHWGADAHNVRVFLALGSIGGNDDAAACRKIVAELADDGRYDAQLADFDRWTAIDSIKERRAAVTKVFEAARAG